MQRCAVNPSLYFITELIVWLFKYSLLSVCFPRPKTVPLFVTFVVPNSIQRGYFPVRDPEQGLWLGQPLAVGLPTQ